MGLCLVLVNFLSCFPLSSPALSFSFHSAHSPWQRGGLKLLVLLKTSMLQCSSSPSCPFCSAPLNLHWLCILVNTQAPRRHSHVRHACTSHVYIIYMYLPHQTRCPHAVLHTHMAYFAHYDMCAWTCTICVVVHYVCTNILITRPGISCVVEPLSHFPTFRIPIDCNPIMAPLSKWDSSARIME